MSSKAAGTSSAGRSNRNQPARNNSHDMHDANRPRDQDDDDDDDVDEEVPRQFDSSFTHRSASQPNNDDEEHERPKTPAYVAPIPKIGRIPRVSSSFSKEPDPGLSSSRRPQLPPQVGAFLVGKRVDEFGDIVDDATGQVFARAGGDLPEMVGRRVSNQNGDILGDDGELLGWIESIELPKKNKGGESGTPKPRSLFELIGQAGGLMVDHAGNILDAKGEVVGKFRDNNNPLHQKEKEEREGREKGKSPAGPEPEPGAGDEDNRDSKREPEPAQEPQGEEGQRRPRRSESERRRNAQDWRKENPDESPSDIFLDVKSTTEGIQLTIRIPTVFGSNGQQLKPNISFS